MTPPEHIYSLWDEVADYPAARIDEALTHLMHTLGDWVRADDVLWVGGVRMNGGANGSALARQDAQHGWRGRSVRRLRPLPAIEVKSRQAVRAQDTDPGMATPAIAREAGKFRSYRLRDGFIDFDAFRRSGHYRRFYREAGISDRLWVVCPVNADTEAYFVFDLYRTRRRFSETDAALAGMALRGLKWFHRGVMLNHGLLIAAKPLSPTQRRLLAFLLTGKSEREIAAAMGLTPATVHTYITALYRLFGVSGRPGLTALWLGP